MRLDDFDYDLPQEFIAQEPLEKRDHSKLLAYNRATDKVELLHFFDILKFLKKGDVLVLNVTRVIPARLVGIKEGTGANIEVFLHKKLTQDTYECLVKPLKRLKTGDKVFFGRIMLCELVSKDNDTGTAVMRFLPMVRSLEPIESLLEKAGTMPLPHYITKPLPRGEEERYQTVYNKTKGSVAAPTAGFHWTPELIEAAKAIGVIFAEVVLHVGLGTFRPVKCDDITEHKMHSERYEIPQETAEIIASAKRDGRRVICVGTTSLRTLEGGFNGTAACGETDIFIYPPYKFKIADALITNFHLPKSTLLMLISAFVGRDKILELYELAKKNNFRFFSFGDSMFIE
jgi:S-adenosylmethionine:tRNA ribosyltransferase-isomerase